MRGATVAVLCAAALLAGCEQCPTTLFPMEQVVAEYNANARAAPRLWARAKIEMTLADEAGRAVTLGSASPLASPNGLLLLAKDGARPLGPHNFALIGRELGQEVFRLGASAEEGVYYLWYRAGDKGGAWYGRNQFAGAPGVRGVSIDPNQLLAVLTLCELPPDSTAFPAVALTMSRDPCAYVLTYIERQSVTGKIVFRREIYIRWSDRDRREPFLVKFFDNQGRRIMTAHLRDYRPIDTPAPEDDAEAARRQAANLDAVMPTDIEIVWEDWPGRTSPVRRLRMVLSEMTTADKWATESCRFRENLPPNLRPVLIDEDLDRKGPRK
ncbi:MAG TPA: hypothetical protein DCX07_15880 [Phycisphaerales bacterium]|nr:hypothetical protein [Phycisphaerales bacterium]